MSSSSSSEDLYAASPTPQPPQKKLKRKRCVYELVEEFNSYENVDAYLRLHNQYSIYTTFIIILLIVHLVNVAMLRSTQ